MSTNELTSILKSVELTQSEGEAIIAMVRGRIRKLNTHLTMKELTILAEDFFWSYKNLFGWGVPMGKVKFSVAELDDGCIELSWHFWHLGQECRGSHIIDLIDLQKYGAENFETVMHFETSLIAEQCILSLMKIYE